MNIKKTLKTIRQRIKRALAALLREELLEYIGYNHNIPFMSLNDRFMVDHLPFETVVMEVEIPIHSYGSHTPDHIRLEHQIEQCKKEFAERVLEHIHVDAQNLTTPEHYMMRSVRFVLRVQGKR